jgi:hypothetical protein
MSWFNRRPSPKNPPVAPPKASSPISEKYLKEMKEAVRKRPENDRT